MFADSNGKIGQMIAVASGIVRQCIAVGKGIVWQKSFPPFAKYVRFAVKVGQSYFNGRKGWDIVGQCFPPKLCPKYFPC